MVEAGYIGVKRLSVEHPDWIPIVITCFENAQKGSQFAGKWILQDLQRKGWHGLKYANDIVPWFPGLGLLVGYGILKHEDTTRGGRRAYYTMPDIIGVEKALRELGFLKG